MEFYNFDAKYVELLTAGDPAVVEHFNTYFSSLILIKLRSRQFGRHTIDDIKQETFLRVFQALRRDGIRQPERMGAFVNSVCNNVVLEYGRSGSRITYMDDPPEAPDEHADSERHLIDDERRSHVRELLSQMTAKNQRLLTAVFYEERPPDEVCDELGIDRGYLRVLLFRARTKLKQAARKDARPRGAAGSA